MKNTVISNIFKIILFVLALVVACKLLSSILRIIALVVLLIIFIGVMKWTRDNNK